MPALRSPSSAVGVVGSQHHQQSVGEPPGPGKAPRGAECGVTCLPGWVCGELALQDRRETQRLAWPQEGPPRPRHRYQLSTPV